MALSLYIVLLFPLDCNSNKKRRSVYFTMIDWTPEVIIPWTGHFWQFPLHDSVAIALHESVAIVSRFFPGVNSSNLLQQCFPLLYAIGYSTGHKGERSWKIAKKLTFIDN